MDLMESLFTGRYGMEDFSKAAGLNEDASASSKPLGFDSDAQLMTEAEKEEQRRSFVHGNCSIDNPNVTRKIVDGAADELERRATVNDVDPDFDEYWSDFYDPRDEREE